MGEKEILWDLLIEGLQETKLSRQKWKYNLVHIPCLCIWHVLTFFEGYITVCYELKSEAKNNVNYIKGREKNVVIGKVSY